MCVHVLLVCMYTCSTQSASHLQVISGVALVQGDDRRKVALPQHKWWQLYCCCGNLQNNNVVMHI